MEDPCTFLTTASRAKVAHFAWLQLGIKGAPCTIPDEVANCVFARPIGASTPPGSGMFFFAKNQIVPVGAARGVFEARADSSLAVGESDYLGYTRRDIGFIWWMQNWVLLVKPYLFGEDEFLIVCRGVGLRGSRECPFQSDLGKSDIRLPEKPGLPDGVEPRWLNPDCLHTIVEVHVSLASLPPDIPWALPLP